MLSVVILECTQLLSLLDPMDNAVKVEDDEANLVQIVPGFRGGV